jgi:hypothetical protein
MFKLQTKQTLSNKKTRLFSYSEFEQEAIGVAHFHQSKWATEPRAT